MISTILAATMLLESVTLIVWDKPTGMDAKVIFSERIEVLYTEDTHVTAEKIYQPWTQKPFQPEYIYYFDYKVENK